MTVIPRSSDKAIREHFSGNTDLYVDKYEAPYRAMCQERLNLLARYLDAGSKDELKILDIGCGAAVFVDLFLDQFRNARAYCIDSSSGMLHRNVRMRRKDLILGDARALPFRPASFDIINLDALMHHMIDFRGYSSTIAGIERLLLTLDNLLKPGGLLIIREIYHEFLFREHLGSYLIFLLSTIRLPKIISIGLKAIGLNTANAGVCFLTRHQWAKVIDQARYDVIAMEDKPWTNSPFRIFGFRSSGDMYLMLSRSAQ